MNILYFLLEKNKKKYCSEILLRTQLKKISFLFRNTFKSEKSFAISENCMKRMKDISQDLFYNPLEV